MKPVFGLDIDGTLVDYHRHFMAFAEQYFPITLPEEPYDARLPFHKYLGVGKTKYRECKMAYRRGELKRSVPLLPEPYPQASAFTRKLRSWGAEIWLCTTRPYLAYDAVDAATRHNLKRHGIAYNGILWGEHKYRELVQTVGKERIVGVLDDLPSMCEQANALGLKTAFALRDHNKAQLEAYSVKGYVPWSIAYDHTQSLALLQRWLSEWRRDNQ